MSKRLEPYRKDSWYETVRAAHAAGISLQETVLGNNMNNEDGTAVYYWYGCSVAMVEIDSLSGESKVRKFKESELNPSKIPVRKPEHHKILCESKSWTLVIQLIRP